MDEERRREVARMGGRAAHQKGTAHEFSPEEAREAGRKGGRAVSQNREHMSAIGREGGESRAANHTRRTAEGSDEPTGTSPNSGTASRTSDENADEMTD
jgi:general stress protein YciG